MKAGKGPWPKAARRRLSAILHPRDDDPKDFFLDVDAAWSIVGGGEALPEKLDVATEVERALRHRHVSWQTKAGRCFSDESWNALVALWTAKHGLAFALDVMLAGRSDDQDRNVFSSDDGAPWYAMRRYAHHVSLDEYRKALERLRPEFEKAGKNMDDYKTSHQRDYMAFAFARETGWPDQLLKEYVENDGAVGELAVLVAACTDAALATKAAKKYGGFAGTGSYFVFDLVESLGRDAAPLLKTAKPFSAPEKKRVADALAIAEAL